MWTYCLLVQTMQRREAPTMCVSSMLIVACILFQAGCISAAVICNYRSPVLEGTMRLPRGSELMSLETFDAKMAGKTLHGFITGYHPSVAFRQTNAAELQFVRSGDNTVLLNLRSQVGGSCTFQDVFQNLELEIYGVDGYAEFKNRATGTYITMFSSKPDSYLWVAICVNHLIVGPRRCRAEEMVVNLYTVENLPNNINLEAMGRDLRIRTCLTMEDLGSDFTFVFNHGENECAER